VGCVNKQKPMNRRPIIPYAPHLKEVARQLRNNSTLSEVLLWLELKGGQMKGYDFHRQKPIDNYVVDFFCHELMLAIEIDGISHSWENAGANEDIRQTTIEQFGIQFLRFEDKDVKQNMGFVLNTIYDWIVEYERGKK
jgi:very-short-patch-repair endonuclease